MRSRRYRERLMSPLENSSTDTLMRKLLSVFTLSDEEGEAIRRLPLQLADIKADQDIVREGDSPSRCCILIEGFASIHKVTGEGRRQIMAFQIAGDVPDLQSLHLTYLDSSIGTLSRCKVGFVRHEALRELCRTYPRIGDALWRTTLIDASIFREWIANVGQRPAYARLAHVLCETYARMKAMGLAEGDSCDFLITQQELAEATGMSSVHVNRTIQDLREAKLIRLTTSRLTILDWDALVAAGDFSAEYLHLKDEGRSLSP
jgi:CRP-like cAMP-binding protein